MAKSNTQMGVSGIGEFKNAMNEARMATRTLDSEMKLAQAQFKATGDAETYLQQRTTILAQQISQQEKAAQAARSALEAMRASGVEQSSRAYQDMQRAVYDAERQLVQLRQEADKTGDEVLDLSSDSDKLAKSLDDIGKTSRFTAIANGFQAVASITRTVWNNVQRIGRTVGESADWADELITTAKQYGMSTTELQQYQYASRFVDTEVSAILKARDKLMQKTKGEGMLFLTDGMTQYGVALRDADDQARDTMDVFWDFIDVLGQFANETERDAIAQEYFGKSFRELNTLVEAGRAGWEEYMNRADVVSEGDIERLGQLDDQLEEIDSKWEHLKNTTIAGFAPAISAALDGAVAYVSNFVESIDSILKGFGILDSDEGLQRPIVSTGFTGKKPMADFSSELAEAAESAGTASGEATVSAFASGAAEAAEYAYNAGAAMGAAFASGAASAAATFGSGWGNTTNNTTTQNFGDTYNYYNSGYAGYTEEQQRQLAGYGG